MGELGKSGVRIAKRNFVVKRGIKARIIHKSRVGVLSFNDLMEKSCSVGQFRR